MMEDDILKLWTVVVTEFDPFIDGAKGRIDGTIRRQRLYGPFGTKDNAINFAMIYVQTNEWEVLELESTQELVAEYNAGFH